MSSASSAWEKELQLVTSRPNAKDKSAQLRLDFASAVNMTAAELQEWLGSAESLSVGWKGSDGSAEESVGHASGRKIVIILQKKSAQLTAADYEHMRKVIGFIRRHTAQRPENIYTSRWRYSLMNWGHDPLKEDQQ